MEKEKILEARNVIEAIHKNALEEKYIRELYRILGNEDIPLTFSTHKNSLPASFYPKFMYILVNIEKLNKLIEDMITQTLSFFNINDIELLKPYLAVYALCHEIEHSNQKLIADKIKKPNYDFEIDVYHDIFEILHLKKYILPRPISLTRDIIKFIIYQKNAYNFILERNASIEGYNVASNIANLCNDNDVLENLIENRNIFLIQGYVDDSEGCLKYTYRTLGIMKKYNSLVFPNDMSLDEKARKGLELSDEESNKVILALKKTMHFK